MNASGIGATVVTITGVTGAIEGMTGFNASGADVDATWEAVTVALTGADTGAIADAGTDADMVVDVADTFNVIGVAVATEVNVGALSTTTPPPGVIVIILPILPIDENGLRYNWSISWVGILSLLGLGAGGGNGVISAVTYMGWDNV